MSVSNHYPLILDLEGVGGEGGVWGDRDGEDMWTQGLFISMYDKIHYKKKKNKKHYPYFNHWLVRFHIFKLYINWVT